MTGAVTLLTLTTDVTTATFPGEFELLFSDKYVKKAQEVSKCQEVI